MNRPPQVLIERSRRALAEAINLLEQVDRLCDEAEKLEAATSVLVGGADGDGDPECQIAQEWSKETGQWDIGLVLVAAADHITRACHGTNSCYRDERAWQLRKRFSDLLEPVQAPVTT